MSIHHQPPNAESLLSDHGNQTSITPEGLPSAWVHLGESDASLSETVPDGELAAVLATAASIDPLQVPGYVLLEEIGRGANGVVYTARQTGLGRVVALKMLLGHHLTPESIARFRQEAESLARLTHPNIVQVYEVGDVNGLPYFSMEHCPGGSLANRLGGAPVPSRVAADLCASIAAAMQAAHEAGVVHRDLKPGNILLTRVEADGSKPSAPSTKLEGSFAVDRTAPFKLSPSSLVKISDFGLAKHLDAEGSHTRSGAILGTPNYMAPEQADGRTGQVTAAADVYAAGAVLYEMLTGRPPFKGVTIFDTLDQVRQQCPVPPSRLQSGVPRDLETICLKCLEKDPRRRYASAGELADDLQRFLDGKSIRARRVTWVENAWRWGKRRPALAGVAAVAMLAVLASIGVGFWYSRQLGTAEGEARVAIGDARAAAEREQVARDRVAAEYYRSLLDGAREAIARGRVGWRDDALARLDKAARIDTPSRAPDELRSALAACLAGTDLRVARVVAPDLFSGVVAFRPERPHLAVGQSVAPMLTSCRLQVVDVADGSVVFDLPIMAKGIWRNGKLVPDGFRAIVFSPDGRWLAAGTRAGAIYRWDLSLARPEAVPIPGGHSGGVVHRLAFSPSGKSLYSTGADKRLVRWDTEDGWKSAARFEPGQAVVDLAVLADGRILASAGNQLYFLDPITLKNARDPAATGGGLFSARPDGLMLAMDTGRQVGLFALTGPVTATRSLRDPIGESISDGPLAAVQFSPDGTLLVTTASSDDDRRLKLWDALNGRLLVTLAIPGTAPISPAFSTDGRFLAVTGNRRATVYEVVRSGVLSATSLSARPVRAFAWSPDGAEMAAVTTDDNGYGRFAIGATTGDSLRFDLPFANAGGRGKPCVAWSADDRIAWCNESAHLHVVDARSPDRGWSVERVLPRVLAFDSAGSLWGGVADKLHCWWAPADALVPPASVEVWNNLIGDITRGLSDINDIAAEAGTLAIGTREGGFRLFRRGERGPAESWTFPDDPVLAVALSGDERVAAAGVRNGTLRLFDVQQRKLILTIIAHADSLDALAISRDGTLLATGARDGTLRVWRLDDSRAEPLFTVQATVSIRKVRFCPGGHRLAVLGAGEMAVRVWHLDRLRQELEGHGLSW